MGNLQKMVSLLFEQVANLASKMSDAEVNELLAGNLVLEFVKKDRYKKTPTKKSALEQVEIEDLVGRLRKAEERRIGLDLLQELSPSKTTLEQIAKSLDIPINQRDNIETIKEKIVEATIGYRLRSMAIQGKSTPNQPTNKDTQEQTTS